jgi:hypothetical protein
LWSVCTCAGVVLSCVSLAALGPHYVCRCFSVPAAVVFGNAFLSQLLLSNGTLQIPCVLCFIFLDHCILLGLSSVAVDNTSLMSTPLIARGCFRISIIWWGFVRWGSAGRNCRAAQQRVAGKRLYVIPTALYFLFPAVHRWGSSAGGSTDTAGMGSKGVTD